MKQGQVHTDKDVKTTWEVFMKKQRLILGALKGLNRVFKTGMDWGKSTMERTWLAKEIQSSAIPLITLLSKDHKPPGEDGIPKTRPTCLAHSSPNGELSEWIADWLEAAIDARGTTEAISTEDMLSKVDRAAQEISRRRWNMRTSSWNPWTQKRSTPA